MQSTQTPTLVPLAFAANGTKNAIPEASQIGITNGAASLNDGFPPLTMTPIAAGGVPPSGADMNGILFLATSSIRWLHAGGLYGFSSSFAGDTNVGGYPNGAELMSADLQGTWISLADNNTDNPDTGPGTKWIPGRAYGVTSIAGLTNANVTLTPAQAAKNKITLAGTLTGNIQIILPTWTREWTIVNNTTGAFTVTAKTASGSGVVLASGQQKVTGDGTNIIQNAESIPAATLGTQPATLSQVQQGGATYAVDTGAANIYGAPYSPAITALVDGMKLRFRASNANTGGSTFTPNPGVISAQPIIGGAFSALQGGEIVAGGIVEVEWSASASSWIILSNPGGASQVGSASSSKQAVQLGQLTQSGVVPGRLLNIQIFTSSGTYTPTAGTSRVKVRCIGGGGGGGGTPATSTGQSASGGGGASGSYAEGYFANSTSQTVTVGAGGSSSSGGNGTAGGTSSFGSLISCPGGGGGGVGTITTSWPAFGSVGGVPGAVPTGSGANIASAAGTEGGYGLLLSASIGTGGAGSPSQLGAGGAHTAGIAGSGASGRGSGGSGASAFANQLALSGGLGSAGVVVIEEYM